MPSSEDRRILRRAEGNHKIAEQTASEDRWIAVQLSDGTDSTGRTRRWPVVRPDGGRYKDTTRSRRGRRPEPDTLLRQVDAEDQGGFHTAFETQGPTWADRPFAHTFGRSEERRVGKEGRSRWWPDH